MNRRYDPAIRKALVFMYALAKVYGLVFRLDETSRPSIKAMRDEATPEYIKKHRAKIDLVGKELLDQLALRSQYHDPNPILIGIVGKYVTIGIELPSAEYIPPKEKKPAGRPAANSADSYEEKRTVEALADGIAPPALSLDAWKKAVELVFNPDGEKAAEIRKRLSQEEGDSILYFLRKAAMAVNSRVYSSQGIAERNISTKAAGYRVRINPAAHKTETSGGVLYLALATAKDGSFMGLLKGMDAFTKAWSEADQRERGQYGKRTEGQPKYKAKRPIEVDALPDGQNRLYRTTNDQGEQIGAIWNSKSLKLLSS